MPPDTKWEDLVNTCAHARKDCMHLLPPCCGMASRNACCVLVSVHTAALFLCDALVLISQRASLACTLPIPPLPQPHSAWRSRVDLCAHGFMATPNLHWDWSNPKGCPFNYFCYGASVSEVELDTLSGDLTVLRTDICMDVGNSLNPAIDVGQVEGGFVQGMGWLMLEELKWRAEMLKMGESGVGCIVARCLLVCRAASC